MIPKGPVCEGAARWIAPGHPALPSRGSYSSQPAQSSAADMPKKRGKKHEQAAERSVKRQERKKQQRGRRVAAQPPRLAKGQPSIRKAAQHMSVAFLRVFVEFATRVRACVQVALATNAEHGAPCASQACPNRPAASLTAAHDQLARQHGARANATRQCNTAMHHGKASRQCNTAMHQSRQCNTAMR